MEKNKRIKILEIIKEHVRNNKKEYIIVSLLFIIGIFLGVLFINNVQESQKLEITAYLNTFIEKMKNIDNLNYVELLKNSMVQNILLAIVLWFFGTTVIGIPVVFGIVMYRGFCLGYTIAVCITIMGFPQGVFFVLILLLLQNILFIPAILALAVSGFKLYKSIIKDINKENIKIEVVRHTIFSFIMLIVLLISSVIEIFVSTNILKILIKYF
jgi:stage II sporulation protein M